MAVRGGDKVGPALAALAMKLKSAETVRIGFLEGSTYPDGTSVPEIAAIQNFGAPASNIPPRPFFSGMVKEKSPEWGKKFARVLKAADYDASLGLARMGEGISGQLQSSILDTDEPALAPSTVAAKGFDKPLIDTAHMINSIAYQVDDTEKVEAPSVSAGRIKKVGSSKKADKSK